MLAGSPFGMAKSWEGERLTAAGAMGIPQVLAPGGLEQIAYGPVTSLPAGVLDDYRTGRRPSHRGSGRPYSHNESVTIVGCTLEEIEEAAHHIAEKLNRVTGPACFVLPMRGWSAPRRVPATRRRNTSLRPRCPCCAPWTCTSASSKAAARTRST